MWICQNDARNESLLTIDSDDPLFYNDHQINWWMQMEINQFRFTFTFGILMWDEFDAIDFCVAVYPLSIVYNSCNVADVMPHCTMSSEYYNRIAFAEEFYSKRNFQISITKQVHTF